MPKATRLKFSYFWGYIGQNWLLSAVGAYMIFSVILRLSTGIDWGIPCLISTLTGQTCPACGLTRAFLQLLRLDFQGAYAYNPLIFIVFPAGVGFLLWDFWAYVQKQESKATD